MNDFDIEKQKLLIDLMLSNSALFTKCNPIIKYDYFDPSIAKAVKFSQDYFEKYKAIPSPQIIKGETGFEVSKEHLTRDEQDYVSHEIEKFCRFSAAINLAYKAPQFIEKDDLETLWQQFKEVAGISISTDLGISYFDNVVGRLTDLLENSPVIPTGWIEFDEAIGGGLVEEEMLLWAAASGVGKSIVMSNLAINLVQQGYNGVYISLELADRVVSKRFDSMTTGFSQADILKNIEAVSNKVGEFKMKGAGELYIKRMPESTTTANHIRAYLKEFQTANGYTPKFIIVDYLDLMATNKNISSENMWLSDKFKAEELRSIGADFKCAIVTASQLGRSSWDAEKISQAHIQGGISKIQTADLMVSIVQSDQMRAAGEYLFEFTKTRNSGAVGSAILMKWDPIALRVLNMEEDKKLKLNKPSERVQTVLDNIKFGSNSEKPSLLDFINK